MLYGVTIRSTVHTVYNLCEFDIKSNFLTLCGQFTRSGMQAALLLCPRLSNSLCLYLFHDIV